MPFQTFTARLVRSVALSELTKHLEFEMMNVARFGFVAGQWLSFKTNKPDGEEIVRAYSIASPPDSDNKFALCLNRVQDGFMSNFLCDMKEGDEIACQGPFGDFILRPPMRDTIFIATGTGIAPFRSMLQLAFERRNPPSREAALFDFRQSHREGYLLSRRIRRSSRRAPELSLPTYTQPRRSLVGRIFAAMCRNMSPAIVQGRNRHACLHLRSRQDGQSQS